MLCSPAEIERKKREALQRLAKKGISPGSPRLPSNGSVNLNRPSSGVAVVHSGPSGVINGTGVQNMSVGPQINNYRKEMKYKNPAVQSSFPKRNKSFSNHNTKPYDRSLERVVGSEKVITAKISLISVQRFVVDLSSFCQPAIDVFKTIPTRSYDANTRVWSFDIKDCDLLVSKLEPLCANNTVVLEQLPKFVINCLKKEIPACDIDFTKLDPELCSTLLPFQVDGLRFGIERNGKCLIADDMGLGKTFQALAIMNYYKDDWPLLIVTTASMKNVWEETIARYLPSVNIMHIQYMTTSKDYIGDSKILIVSHDLMQRCCDKLLERNFGAIIIDESHNLKNFKTKQAQSAMKLSKRAKRIVLLSGTPALSRPSELYQQLVLIDNNFFGQFANYAKRYCDRKSTPWGFDDTGSANLQELEIILLKRFMIRRTKENVLKSLPNKKQERVLLDVHLEKFSKEDRESLMALSNKYNSQKGSEKHSTLLVFFSQTAKIKVASVCSYVLQVLEQNHKFLIFAHHQVMLNAIEDVVKRKNIQYIRIDGNTTGDQRKYFMDKFQTQDSCKCAILSILAANAGVTLTAAQLILFAELHWNPTILSQAEARAHRIGQENEVLVQYLLAPGTADDTIWKLLQEKEKSLSNFGLCKVSLKDDMIEKSQNTHNEMLTEGLNITRSNVTCENTLDITSYFKRDDESISEISKENSVEEFDEVFDDGLDDVLSNVEFFNNPTHPRNTKPTKDTK